MGLLPGADLKMKISHRHGPTKDGIDENDSKTLAYFEMLDGLKRGAKGVSTAFNRHRQRRQSNSNCVRAGQKVSSGTAEELREGINCLRFA